MKPLNQQQKHQTKGGLSELAIFGIITAIGAGMSLISGVATGIMNAKANKQQKNVRAMNLNYESHANAVVY